jgi:hypothetical protein
MTNIRRYPAATRPVKELLGYSAENHPTLRRDGWQPGRVFVWSSGVQ